MKGKRGLTCSLAALAVLLASVVIVAPWDLAKAATFNPTVDVTLPDDTAGANAEMTYDFNILGGDANYEVNIAFTPAEFGLGADIPLGAYVADLDALATLGLLNQPCITTLEVSFAMLNATLDTSDTVSYQESCIDADANTLPDGVDKYPDFLKSLFPGLTPTLRMFGATSVAGVAETMNMVIFEPGTTLYGIEFDAALGRPSVQVLNDPTLAPSPTAITDFCTPLSAAITTFGVSKDNPDTVADESGYVVSTNPTTAGDYTFTTYATSLRDADGDGLDNSLDTCPYDVDTGLDDDYDGLDNACDPDPFPGVDYDYDGYMNRGDNCPLVPNDQADADDDDIGDACDDHPNDAEAEGESIEVYLEDTVTIVGAPEETPTPTPVTEEGALQNCPQSGKWAISVWSGDDGSDAEQALGTCGQGAVAVAYSIDPDTQVWSRWFADRPEISNLTALNNMQGVMVLGGTQAPTAPSTPTPSPTLSPTATPTPAGAAAGGPPTDYLDTFHAALEMSMEMDIFEMDFAIEGDFEAPGSCSCDISASMWGIPIIEQRVIVIDNTAWIDTGDGWHETTPSDPEVVETLGMCPACPSFWEDAAVEPPSLPGEHETKNGVPAIHYTLAELYEGLAGIGLIPEEMEGVSIETFDIWLAEDGKWLVCLDMEICVEAEAMEEEIGMPVDEIDSVCMEMSINITDANDTGIQVNAPLPGASGPSAQQEAMQNCPQAGKWAIAVWNGDDGIDAEQAFATCGEGAVAVAYSIDPDTQLWSRWFADRPEISNLTALDNMEGVMALGSAAAPTPGPLKIGILVPYTGALRDFGEPWGNAAELAVKEINEAGGVLGQDVVLVLGDSATEPVKAMEEARRLIDIEGVSAIIGAAASGVTLPVAEAVAVPSEIVQISPASTSPALTAVYDNDYLFRTTISDAAQGLVLAHLADDLGFTSACTMYVNNAYGQGLSEQFAETFEDLGGTVTAQVSHATEEQVTYLLELNWCVEGNPDVLAALSYPEHGRVYLKEALEVGLIDTFLFVDGTKSDTMFEALGWHDFEGMYGTAPGSLEVAAGTTFDNAYEAEYGEKPPMPFMRETYDAVYVIALAAAKASSTDSTAMRNALRDIANPPGEAVNPGVDGFEEALGLIAAGADIDYQGAAGPIDFDPNGDVLQGAIEIWQISGGEIVEAVRTFEVDLTTTPPAVTEVTG